MSDVVVTVELDDVLYSALLKAANEAGVSVSEFAGATIENYLGENYGSV